jgi:hypothetical protein
MRLRRECGSSAAVPSVSAVSAISTVSSVSAVPAVLAELLSASVRTAVRTATVQGNTADAVVEQQFAPELQLLVVQFQRPVVEQQRVVAKRTEFLVEPFGEQRQLAVRQQFAVAVFEQRFVELEQFVDAEQLVEFEQQRAIEQQQFAEPEQLVELELDESEQQFEQPAVAIELEFEFQREFQLGSNIPFLRGVEEHEVANQMMNVSARGKGRRLFRNR